jgi:hypothetical protein
MADALMNDIDEQSQTSTMRFKHDSLTIQFIYPGRSKPRIDDLDRLIGQHYGLSEREIDYIVNYDAKYRVGADEDDA